MRETITVAVIAFSVVGINVFLGFSETSGLFGAIVAVGGYVANLKGDAK